MKLTTMRLRSALLKELVKSKMSLRQLAKTSGVPYSTLWNLWNTGFNPTLETTLNLAEALGIRLEIK